MPPRTAIPAPAPEPAAPPPLSAADRTLLAAVWRANADPAAAAASAGLDLADLLVWLAEPRIRHYLALFRELRDFRRDLLIDDFVRDAVEGLRTVLETDDLVERRRAACAILRAVSLQLRPRKSAAPDRSESPARAGPGISAPDVRPESCKPSAPPDAAGRGPTSPQSSAAPAPVPASASASAPPPRPRSGESADGAPFEPAQRRMPADPLSSPHARTAPRRVPRAAGVIGAAGSAASARRPRKPEPACALDSS